MSRVIGVPSIPEKDGETIKRVELCNGKTGEGKVLSFLDYYPIKDDSWENNKQFVDTGEECWNNYLSTLLPKKNETPEELEKRIYKKFYEGKLSWKRRTYEGDGFWSDF